ncbi:MAG TPA: hypothetical protein VK469_15635 [Candidatus Kapabacteria bacterium]|nr:hypothetical protein [Candidatus Kapabacteria bacterium]
MLRNKVSNTYEKQRNKKTNPDWQKKHWADFAYRFSSGIGLEIKAKSDRESGKKKSYYQRLEEMTLGLTIRLKMIE